MRGKWDAVEDSTSSSDSGGGADTPRALAGGLHDVSTRPHSAAAHGARQGLLARGSSLTSLPGPGGCCLGVPRMDFLRARRGTRAPSVAPALEIRARRYIGK
ncbi:hypothetical protein ASNO1_10340 [Corallococcus caeni]|uniref:Uncharacterized protein n=1 Tax=Corallococcus caeni TaxID=3082388 RepID=A0ABQ6QL79_9BACT|nr:hypothetical protein ASNO1_10340 [Corallococcus sp. NO1]